MTDLVIPADHLGQQVLEDVFKSMPPTKRGIAIGIANETPYKWSGMSPYFRSGKPGSNMIPEFVKSKEAALPDTKPTGEARGNVGVLTFFIPRDNKTVAVMFSVPFDRNLYINWWDAKVYRGKKEADHDMYFSAYYNHNPFKGEDGWHEKHLDDGYSVKGIMTSGGQCKMKVKIFKSTE